MEFPHLGDTAFPHLGNVNVYAYKNDFDYTRWKASTKVRLTNVLWNSDYRDVVKFDTNEQRDEWFDSMEDVYEITLTADHSMPPEGGIKLPIPFDVAARYNYLVVDIPTMTSEENPIEYESSELGVRRWFFFVNEISSRAPSTTMFEISLDVWTQFANDIEIRYMFLERGHAPVAATDVDDYLANPIANNDYLLTPDVTPTQALNVASHEFIPFGNGTKYVCIASNIAPNRLTQLGRVTHDSPDYMEGRITYSDDSARYGYQLIVNGFGAGYGEDYSNLYMPTSPVANNNIANNVFCYAVPATDVYGNGTFFNDLMRDSPVFMRNILGCFVVDESMIQLVRYYVVAGHRIYQIAPMESTRDIALSKDMFGYPEIYQRFAKLYTHPYAEIELTDNEGEVVTVRIESTGSMRANLVPEIAFPYLNMRVFFTGINGVGSTRYSWTMLDGMSIEREMPNSDWFEYCFDHEIPCYSIYMDGEVAWSVDNFHSILKQGRSNALVAYHNAARNANTARANAVDSDATMYANADRDATTYTTNVGNTADTNRANTDLTIATNTLLRDLAILSGTNIKNFGNEKANSSRQAANTFTTTTTDATTQTSVSNSITSSVGQVAGQIGSYAVGASVAGGMLGSVVPGVGNAAGAAGGMAVGALMGLSNVAANAIADFFTATASAQVSAATAGQQILSNDTGYNASERYTNNVQSQLNTDISNNNTNKNALLSAHVNNNNDCNNTNAANTAATMRNNAAASRNTGDANAGYTREVSILNAKETLENSRNGIMGAMRDADFHGAVPIGEYAGNPTADYYMTRGIQVKVRTMPKAEVRAVGDWFARYGYALDQIWDVDESGLCPMNHFCYWKCRDIWVDDRKSSNNAAQALITSMFERGVTVWRNPEEIGKVSVYDN